MSSLSILLVALYCTLHIYSKIGGVDSRPPDYGPIGPFIEDATQAKAVPEYKANLQEIVPILKKKLNRLPGVCRRLKRRRITILCNTEKFCSAMKYSQHGQICTCPKRSKCTHFFLWSL